MPRRIVPTLITETGEPVGNIAPPPVGAFRHAATDALAKHAERLDDLYRRVEEASGSKSKSRSKRHDGNGDHHQHLANFEEYVVRYAELKSVAPHQSMAEMLRKQFDAGKYYSTKTKRFRKY